MAAAILAPIKYKVNKEENFTKTTTSKSGLQYTSEVYYLSSYNPITIAKALIKKSTSRLWRNLSQTVQLIMNKFVRQTIELFKQKLPLQKIPKLVRWVRQSHKVP